MVEPIANLSEEQPEAVVLPARKRQGRTAWRVLRIGCLSVALLMCGLVTSLTIALQSGPIDLHLPFNNRLNIGSDDFVLSNYNFQDGSTYYLDLDGNGTRNILQVEYISNTRTIQLVLHHSTKEEQNENQLLTLRMP